ncbi:maleylpyruvate isomerase family mycothiol-dependent enzyme [Mycolicibacillus trivialis]|uniref:Maleylpyruvate isomerase family mycothiol-dependent enzyme n=1 Tax=Mycolicibacillus trivialis TaxID=1798 RepID=A0A1X2EMJ9_9MYCO|nr:maleylpyruvate isomerase family mycothiol-dependent enzyme [Mycolicibacillus trivialis]ORX06879.1 hypothetical protein AWC30_04690 [Mycolicibacillus trivialis]
MDFSSVLLQHNRAFGELIRNADPDTPVPTCPEWNLTQLFRHVGRGNLWSAQIVADRADQPVDPRSVPGGKPPADPDGAITWLHDGAQLLLDAVDATGADTPVWTFLGPRPADWWIRRRAHEVIVHRADAALAVNGAPGLDDLPPLLAADAVTEWLELAVPMSGRAETPPLPEGQSIHLHATDGDLGPAGEWTLRTGPDGLTWSHEHGKGSVALRGRAVDLLLAILRRVQVEDTEIAVFGDADVWRYWLDHTPF